MSTVSTTFRKTGLCMAILIIPFFTISCTHLRPNDYGVSESHKDVLIGEYLGEGGVLHHIANRVYDTTTIEVSSGTETIKLKFDKVKRNQVIEDVMYLIDKGFEEFSHDVYENRSAFNIFGDVTNLGLATAGSLVGSSGAKTTYAVLAAAFSGAQLSVDGHIFQNQGTFAIIRMMEAERAKVKTEILKFMKKSKDEYTIGMAFLDLEAYFKAGTLAHSLNKLTETAGKEITLQSMRQSILKQFADERVAFLNLYKFDKKQAENEVAVSQEIINMVNDYVSGTEAKAAAVIRYVTMVDESGTEVVNPEKLKELTDHISSFQEDYVNELSKYTKDQLESHLKRYDPNTDTLYDALNAVLSGEPTPPRVSPKITLITDYFWGDKDKLSEEDYKSILQDTPLEEKVNELPYEFLSYKDNFSNFLTSNPDSINPLLEKIPNTN